MFDLSLFVHSLFLSSLFNRPFFPAPDVLISEECSPVSPSLRLYFSFLPVLSILFDSKVVFLLWRPSLEKVLRFISIPFGLDPFPSYSFFPNQDFLPTGIPRTTTHFAPFLISYCPRKSRNSMRGWIVMLAMPLLRAKAKNRLPHGDESLHG